MKRRLKEVLKGGKWRRLVGVFVGHILGALCRLYHKLGTWLAGYSIGGAKYRQILSND